MVTSIKARVPMFPLALKIFLWFWLTAWGLVNLLLFGSYLTGVRVVAPPNMYAIVAPILAAEAVHIYESDGPEAFARFSQSNVDGHERRLYLLDGFNRDVLSRPLPDDATRLVREAKSGQLVVLRGRWAAYKLVTTTGRPYILLLHMKGGIGDTKEVLLGYKLPFSVSVVVLVTLFCLWLAYHLSSPIYKIQATARQVAQGNLKTRVPISVSRRHDELSALAQDFDSMVDRLDVLVSTQKHLLNSVSHELRSPLARISVTHAMLRERCPPATADMFRRLDDEVARIDLLISQLLTLSRLETGMVAGERGDVDLVQLVEEACADGNFEAQATGGTVSFHADVSAVVMRADPNALRSACENVIRNAVRFTRPGSEVQVIVDVDRSGLEPVVLVRVRDSGPGVPEEHLRAIFQPFFRVAWNDGSTSGNGLGLAIASEAIRLHHGTISARNIEPTGLEIVIQLPVKSSPGGRLSEAAELSQSITS